MKRSLISLICLMASLVLILSGCSKDGAPDGYKNVANENDAFYFYVPTTWVSNTSGGTASAYYSSDDYSNVSFTCMVIDPGKTDTLETYKTTALEEFAAVLPEFKEIAREEKLDENGVKVPDPVIADKETLVFEYECKLGEDHYKYMQAVTMKDNFFYIFTYTSLADNYDKHTAEIENIISNIKFK
ncbi:MAG: hypothetical protein J6S71_08895 [Clostridia bacterium]|nr:hypothetical protein [Clostridia bacterium]